MISPLKIDITGVCNDLTQFFHSRIVTHNWATTAGHKVLSVRKAKCSSFELYFTNIWRDQLVPISVGR